MTRGAAPFVDDRARTIREGGSWTAGSGGSTRGDGRVTRREPGWAAPCSLVLGIVAGASAVLLFASSSAALFQIPPVCAIGALVCARIARGHQRRGSVVRWPGRGMAFAGALLSWVVIVALLALVVIVILAFGAGEPINGTNLP